MKRKGPTIDNFFKPIGSTSQPNVQPSQETDPSSVEVDAQTDNGIPVARS
jgi:hypothetical protein